MSGSGRRSGATTLRGSAEHGRLWLAGGLIVLAVGATAVVGPYITGSTSTAEGVIIACLGAASLLYWSVVRRAPGGLGARAFHWLSASLSPPSVSGRSSDRCSTTSRRPSKRSESRSSGWHCSYTGRLLAGSAETD